MTKTSNYWDKRAIERMTTAEKQSEAYISRIKEMYNQAFKNIDGEIAKVYKNYSKETGLDVEKLKELLTTKETSKTWKTLKRQGLDKYIKNNYKSRISRLEQLQAQIYAKAKQIYPKEELEHTMCYKGVINNSYYKAVYDTQMGTGYDFSFNKIDNNLLNSLLNEKWSGKNYSERIWGNTDILADSVSKIVGGALLSGQGIEKTSKQIRDRFNVSKYYAERLVRTETNHFNNEVDAMAYEEMGVKEYVFVAVLDSRTSEICQANDNKKYLYKDREVGVNYPPLHPNCRSTTRGYLGEEAEKQLKRRARNPITGKSELIDNMSYKEWLKQHDITKTTAPVDELKNVSKNDTIAPSNLLDKLSKDEKYAINKYIGSTSYKINEKLRLNLPLGSDDEKLIENLDNALDKMDNYNGIVTRSVCISSDDVSYFMKDYKINHVTFSNAYMSTTCGETYNPEARIQMFINSKTGKDLRKFNSEEQEILFKRNTKFNVLKVDDTDSFFIKIYMEEL